MDNTQFSFINYGAERMPERIHPEDAGMDIYAPATFHVPPHERVYVSCGFGIAMPDGYMAYTVVRGSTANMGLHIAENPIDSNYRGEVHAVVWNIGNDTVVIKKGDRFCQLVIVPCVCSAEHYSVARVPLSLPVVNIESLESTNRGTGSYGSTDVPKSSDDSPKQHDPLDRAAEVLTFRVFGKPTIAPKDTDEYKIGITSQYDEKNKQVIVRCDADVVTIGITAKVLHRLYMETARKLPVDMMSKVHRVVQEVCDYGQDSGGNP